MSYYGADLHDRTREPINEDFFLATDTVYGYSLKDKEWREWPNPELFFLKNYLLV
jgi:hypothetical protein